MGTLDDMNHHARQIFDMMQIRNEIKIVCELISHLTCIDQSISFRSKILEDLVDQYVSIGISLYSNGGEIPNHMLR